MESLPRRSSNVNTNTTHVTTAASSEQVVEEEGFTPGQLRQIRQLLAANQPLHQVQVEDHVGLQQHQGLGLSPRKHRGNGSNAPLPLPSPSTATGVGGDVDGNLASPTVGRSPARSPTNSHFNTSTNAHAAFSSLGSYSKLILTLMMGAVMGFWIQVVMLRFMHAKVIVDPNFSPTGGSGMGMIGFGRSISTVHPFAPQNKKGWRPASDGIFDMDDNLNPPDPQQQQQQNYNNNNNQQPVKPFFKKGFYDENNNRKNQRQNNPPPQNFEAREPGEGKLAFAIVGFPKCGTSTMMKMLANVTYIPQHEWCPMADSKQANPRPILLQRHYESFPNPSSSLELQEQQEQEHQHDYLEGSHTNDQPPPKLVQIKHTSAKPKPRGIKCPRDLELAWEKYKTFFPRTKLIVGVRHPIKWFESFYNFAVNNHPKGGLTPPMDHVGACRGTNVCTDRGQFHVALSKLGKTPLESVEEFELLLTNVNVEKSLMELRHETRTMRRATKGKVFLYDLEQLQDEDPYRSQQFLDDLKEFLHLEEELPPMMKVTPGKKWNTEEQARRNNNKIDICDEEHDMLRAILLESAVKASRWIRDFFLESEEVVVSSREYLVEILERWEYDPCKEAHRVSKV